jgi:hypothetical protein
MPIADQVLDRGEIRSNSLTSDGDQPTVLPAAVFAARHETAPRARRLSDKVLVAFHQACDQADVEVAHDLLGVLELMLTKTQLGGNNRRRYLDTLVAAYERLWHIKHSV